MDRRPFAALFLTILAASAVSAAEERPPFPAIQLNDLTGQTYSLKSFLGTATVLNFWATWCGPCRLELPELQKLSNELGAKGLVVIAIDMDLPPISEEGVATQLTLIRPRVQEFLSRTGITLPVYLIDGQTQAALSVDRLPFSVLLDKEGSVVRIYPGYSPESIKDLREQALGVLKERPKQGGK